MHVPSLFRAVALAAAALVLVSSLIGALGPARTVECISDKLAELKARAAEVDTLFIGSSRVHHNYTPSVFDRETDRACPP